MECAACSNKIGESSLTHRRVPAVPPISFDSSERVIANLVAVFDQPVDHVVIAVITETNQLIPCDQKEADVLFVADVTENYIALRVEPVADGIEDVLDEFIEIFFVEILHEDLLPSV